MSILQQTEYKLPQAVVANGSTTDNEWSNPDNILLVDGDTADSNASAASDITVGNFNFNLPEGSVITGIEFKVIGYWGGVTSPATTLTFYAVDNTSGQDLFYPYTTPFSGFTTDLEEYSFGSSSYLFSTSWTVNQINNFKLQLVANNALFIDAVLVRVHYYDGNAEPAPEEDTGICISCDSPIQAQPFSLALPMSGTDTGMYVKSFNTPRGIPITMNDVSECGDGSIIMVIDQGKPYGNGNPWEETVRVIDVVSQPNGTVFLDFGSLDNRGLGFTRPYTSDPDNISAHNANSEAIISNAAVYENEKVRACQADLVFSPPITVSDEGAPVTTSLHNLDFRGGSVQAYADPSDPHHVIVNISAGGGTIPPAIATTSSSSTGNARADSLTWEHECLGVNRGLLVQIETEESKTITSVTFNGISLTQLVSETDAPNNIRNEQWFLVAPPAGTFDIVITMSAAAYITAGAEGLVGVDQTTPTGAVDSDKDESTNPNVTLTTQYDNSIIIDSLATALTPILYTKGSNQVENWHITANVNTRQGGSSYQLAGSTPDNVSMEWSITQDTDWVITAVEIKGITTSSGGGGGDVDLTVTQPGHGFVEGDVLRSAGTDGTYAKALATNGSNAEVVGLVKSVTDSNTFVLTKDAYYAGAQIPTGTPGNAIFLSDVTPGLMTLTEPTTPGRISKPLGVLISSGAEMSFTADSRGNVVSSPGGSGVQSVTGLDTDNTDPENPIVQISVDNVTITGAGTPGDPLVATGGGGGGSNTISSFSGERLTGAASPVPCFIGDGSTLTGLATPTDLSGVAQGSYLDLPDTGVASQITVTDASDVNRISVKWRKGSFNTFAGELRIYTNNAGSPGTVVGYAPFDQDDVPFGTGSNYGIATLAVSAQFNLTAGTYWVAVVMTSGFTGTDFYVGGANTGVIPRKITSNNGGSWSLAPGGGTFLDIGFSLVTTPGRFYASQATPGSGRNSFDVFVKTTQNAGVATSGYVNGDISGFTGLSFPFLYYVSNTRGQIDTTPGTTSLKVGKSFSATHLIEYPRT